MQTLLYSSHPFPGCDILIFFPICINKINVLSPGIHLNVITRQFLTVVLKKQMLLKFCVSVLECILTISNNGTGF